MAKIGPTWRSMAPWRPNMAKNDPKIGLFAPPFADKTPARSAENDLRVRHAPEHVKYVTTDPKMAPQLLLGRRPVPA